MTSSDFVARRRAELKDLIFLKAAEFREMQGLELAEEIHWDVETTRVLTDKRGKRAGYAHIFKVYGHIDDVEDILLRDAAYASRRRLIWRIIPSKPALPRARREEEPPSTPAE